MQEVTLGALFPPTLRLVHFLTLFGAVSLWLVMMHHLRLRHGIALAILTVCILVIEFLVSQVLAGEASGWHPTLFVGSALLVTGWIVTNETTNRNHRRQHTITLISDYMVDAVRLKDRIVIKRHLPRQTYSLREAIVDFDEEGSALLQAVDRELNFFEFVAIGLETDDLDRGIVDRALRGNGIAYYRQMEAYIDHWRERDKTTWEHFARLYERWASEVEAEESASGQHL